MKCNDVRNKLDDYLNGRTTIEERENISEHLSSCNECMDEFVKLEGVDFNIVKEKNILKDVSKKFNRKIVRLVICTIIILFSSIYVFIPGVFRAIRFSELDKLTSALADVVQFTQGVNVGGYGNSYPEGKPYTMEFSVYTHTKTGTKVKGMGEVKVDMNVITGIAYSPTSIGSQFFHPTISPIKDYSKAVTKEAAIKMLESNGEDTVATTNISLNQTISIEEVALILSEYDVDVLWMAVESGREGLKPKNMSFGQNQVIQWGIPGKLFAKDGKGIEFKPGTEVEYKAAVIKEMEWLNKNKKLLKPNRNLLKNNGIDSSVSTSVEYVLKNGIKIYGLKLTGPTKELLRLQKSFNIRFEEIVDIDFWYWK